MDKISLLRKELTLSNLDGFIIGTNDRFLNEYVPQYLKRLEFLTGFSGSNGLAIITANELLFFTDGRYFSQAKLELPEYQVFDLSLLPDWIKSFVGILGFNPWLHSGQFVKQFQNKLVVTDNLIDRIHQPRFHQSKIFLHDVRYSGTPHMKKLSMVTEYIKRNRADGLIITACDNLCWLLNIRAWDVEYSPILLGYLTVTAAGEITIFADIKNKDEFLSWFPKIEICPLSDDLPIEKSLKWIVDCNNSPAWFNMNLPKIINIPDPCYLAKAKKNPVEQQCAIDAHIEDGLALSKFLYWLEKSVISGEVDEISAAEKLAEFRQESTNFLRPSFPSIIGFEENAAVIHYHSKATTNKKLTLNGRLLLVDSGGQYYGGTTDVTRTVVLGQASEEYRKFYTLVLKGHIALSRIKFPIGTSGGQLDVLARQFLWQDGLNYQHGTGHGVGCFLNVHEGPQRIRADSIVQLEPGMILSNEPGYYLEGKLGIRLENLVLVEQSNVVDFLQFRTLTLAPYDLKLIDKSMLTHQEIDWLNQYHKLTMQTLSAISKDFSFMAWLSDVTRNL